MLNHRIVELTTTDPAEFEVALQPWELMCRPIDAGNFRHHLLLLQTPQLMMYSESYGLGVHVQGITPPGVVGFCIPQGAGRESKYWGVSHDEASLPASLSGPVEGRLVHGHEQIIIFVDETYLRKVLSPSFYEALIKSARLHQIRTTSAIETNLEAWVTSTLNRFAATPELIGSQSATQATIEQLVDHLTGIAGRLAPATDIHSSPERKHALVRVIDFLRHDRAANVPLHKLCEIAGVGERSLQYAFREELGLTPKEFMIRRRLHAARQELLCLKGSETTVTEVALNYGFTELGRFASLYKKVFGESPSATLGRRS